MSTDSASSPASRPSASRGEPWRGRFVALLLCVLTMLAFLAYLTLFLGCISGQEFSPDVFRRRSFLYYEIPLLGLQVYPISHDDCTGPLETYLRDQRLITPNTKGTELRWDLVFARRGAEHSSRLLAYSEAQILCCYLDAVDDAGNSVWRQWSEEHPAQARVLWPAVARVARQELYLFAPDLLRLTDGNPSAAQLQTKLAATLARKYCSLAASHQALGQHAIALELYAEALVHDPRLGEALRGRAHSSAALAKQAPAK